MIKLPLVSFAELKIGCIDVAVEADTVVLFILFFDTVTIVIWDVS